MQEPYENNDSPTVWDSDNTYDYIPPKKEKKGWGSGRIIALALVCSILGGLFGAGSMYWLGREVVSDSPLDEANHSGILEGDRPSSVIDISQIDTSKLMTPAEVYAANVSATVGITTSITTNFWGYQTTVPASGSGFIFSSDGYILTNFHVVEDSSSITVSMYDGNTYKATLVGYDEGNDVAVLKIDADNLTPVILGNSDNLNVGDSVVAIGNPLGELTFSLTAGAISAKDREITMSNGATMRLMQTDCAINSGNSGGALFNLYGEVIGITNAKYSSNSSNEASIDNIGFAIPINKARSIAESIIEKGYVSKPYAGISVVTISAETQSYGLPQGAAVKAIAEDSPAAEAGLAINDIITHIGGKEITGSSDVVSIVGDSAPGDVLKLTVYRKGKTIQLNLTIGEQIQSANKESPRHQ
ncbi:MAG: trypsin-like peptidase domain-containing protein [Oscillospiraceae bacterium]|nr:trypsin-like peptidase domain-containing protein [Oscillospiraceae bacterium]